MKKTFTVNLGSRVFHIDEDAFDELKRYLSGIEKYFADAAERKEIIDDIERRISELFSERIGNRKEVITISDVREIITILGNPEDIGSSSGEDEQREFYTSNRSRPRGYKRIYRDPENRVLGGVCGGLGVYFNTDPLVFRILFIVFLLLGGASLLVYAIMWIVIPLAKTRAQKMEMRGEPVTFDTIGRNVKEEFEQVKKNMNFRKKSTQDNNP